MRLQQIVEEIDGEIAARAAELEDAADRKEADVAPGPFSIAIASCDGVVATAGAVDRFPIQSIAKVFAVDLALRALGDRVFERFGREPSGDPFNSLIDLERTHGIPRNPFINAGALVVVDMLVEQHGAAARNAILDLINEEIDGEVYLDEEVLNEGGELNRAMLNFMRHHGNIHSSSDEVMDAYARQCAISLGTAGLAEAGRFLVSTRLDPDDSERARRARQNRKVLALMTTCGHYDASGDFAVRVGLPAKSGVGGGILAIAPGLASIAAWSPNLDQHGNSILGVHGLEMLVRRTGWSIFGPPIETA